MRKSAAAIGADVTSRIEDVATRLFILHGYNGVSYLDIARELGIVHWHVSLSHIETHATASAIGLRATRGSEEQ